MTIYLLMLLNTQYIYCIPQCDLKCLAHKAHTFVLWALSGIKKLRIWGRAINIIDNFNMNK